MTSVIRTVTSLPRKGRVTKVLPSCAAVNEPAIWGDGPAWEPFLTVGQ